MADSVIIAGSYDFTVYRQNVRNLTAYYKVNGVAVDLSLWGAEFVARLDHTDTTNEIRKTKADGTIELGSDGRVTVLLQGSDFTPVKQSTMVYSVRLLPPALQAIPLLEGSISLSNEILT